MSKIVAIIRPEPRLVAHHSGEDGGAPAYRTLSCTLPPMAPPPSSLCMTVRPRALALERHRLQRSIELYLRDCFAKRSVARVSELAERLGANRTYVSRIVPAILGMSLGEALREKQLEHAKELLAHSSLKVSEIAAASAFGTERSFFRSFRRAFGVTPSAFRKSNQLSVDAATARR
jgi:AraC-like DNA-binding protein